MVIDRNEYENVLKLELEKIMKWFNANELLLNIDKTSYTFFGPHYNKVRIRGEYNLEELHTVVPRLYLDDFYERYTGPDTSEINIKGEYILQELHDIAPAYILEEHIETDEGVIIMPEDDVKYLGMYIDKQLNFKHHINIVSCRIQHSHRTRNANLTLDYKRPKNVRTYKEPTIASAMFWNSLPNDIREITTKTEFKYELKNYLLSKYE